MAIIKFTDTEDFEDKQQDFHQFVTEINKLFELQGKKVNIDIPTAIASEIIKRHYSVEQLQIAVDRMVDQRFVQIGLPEFLAFLRDGSCKKQAVTTCNLCGEQFADEQAPTSTGFLEAVCFHPNLMVGNAVNEARVLCSCSHGKHLQRFWSRLCRFDGSNRKFKTDFGVYFVFPKDDPKWLAKKWRLKSFLQRA